MSTTPHDALFRTIFSDPESAASELRYCLPPEVAARVDFGSLKLVPGSFVDDGLQARHTDLLFEAQIAGAQARVYVLFEHQSSADRWLVLRLAGYMVRIWEDLLKKSPGVEKLPVIVPVVLAQVDGGWTTKRSLLELMQLPPDALQVLSRYVPNFAVELEDLGELPSEALERRQMAARAKLALLLMQNARRSGDLLALLRRWAAAMPEAFGPEQALVFVWYILYVQPGVGEAAMKDFASKAAPQWKEAVMTAAEQLIQRGREEGRQEGRQAGRHEGWLEGRRAQLVRQLELRFGTLSPALQAQIQAAGEGSLDQWSERFALADSLVAVFGD